MSPSTASTLETLPLIVLENICAYLVECDCKRRDCLRAFSLTSRRCCSAAAAQRFCQIRVTVRGRKELQDDVRRMSQVLSIGDRFRCVRRLKIVGGPKIQEKEEGVLQGSPGATVSEEDEGGEEEEEEEQDDNTLDYFEMEDFCKRSRIPTRTHEYWEDDMPGSKQGDYIEAWQPLADFIGHLAGLRDLVWTYSSRLPHCLFSVIEAMSCRLHMHSFGLDSLIKDHDDPHDVDTDEVALITSPCLYSIVAPYFHWDWHGKPDYTQEAVLRMVAGVSPRLAHVWMRTSPPGDSIELRQAFRTPRPDWSGFFPGAVVPDEHVVGSLQSLFIDCGLSRKAISSWSRHTDFAKLRRLTIHWDYEGRDVDKSLQTLGEIAMGGGLKSLNTLILSIPHFNARPMQSALIQLFEHLNSLEILDLTGFIGSETLKPALIRHGGTLRKLRVTPHGGYGTRRPMVEFSEAVVQRLVGLCPKLEQLEIPINRTHSDERETEIYRALGRLSRLKHVSLNLEFSIGTIERDEEEGEEEIPNDEEEDGLVYMSSRDTLPLADIQDGLINGAIDSSLALSIFNLISSGGSLRHLKLQIARTRGPSSDDGNLNYMLDWIGRNWVCKLDDRGKVSVRELGKKKRAMIEEELGYLEEEFTYLEESNHLAAWNNTWPQTSSDWWQNWKSCPLAGDAEGGK